MSESWVEAEWNLSESQAKAEQKTSGSRTEAERKPSGSHVEAMRIAEAEWNSRRICADIGTKRKRENWTKAHYKICFLDASLHLYKRVRRSVRP